MTSATVTSACLPDPQAERKQLAAMLAGAGLSAAAGALRAAEVGVDGAADGAAECAVIAWARSGLMNLTGSLGGAPLAPYAPVLTRVGLLADAIASLTSPRGRAVRLDIPGLLTGRASLRGWQRQGSISANGNCRLLRAADGWVAVSLSRPCDVSSLPAVIGREPRADAWDELAADAAGRRAAELAAAAQLVGIPAAVLLADQSLPAVRCSRLGKPGPARPFVLDLSAMWAGPLCASILHQAGWRVLKVEDSRRPDGARSGPAAFYASLHAGMPAVRLDFGSATGRAELRRLAAKAGIVLESSRASGAASAWPGR